MNLQELKHWHWVVIGLLLGSLVGGVRAFWASSAGPTGYDRGIKDGRIIENDIMMRDPTTNGYPYFHDMRIVPFKGQQALVAKYMQRMTHPRTLDPKDPKNRGKVEFQEATLVFLPQTAVYVPSNPRFNGLMPNDVEVRLTLDPDMVSQLTQSIKQHGFTETSSPSANVKIGKVARGQILGLAKLGGVRSVDPTSDADTLRGFLQKVKEKHPEWKMDFQYVWHSEPRAQFLMWAVGVLVVVGGIWPFIVNVLSYGTLTHPRAREEKVDLSKVHSTPETKVEKPVVDAGALAAHIAEMEKGLEGFAIAGAAPVPAATKEEDEAVRKLQMDALEATKDPNQADKPKHYAGEFYPTVAHAPKEEN